MKRQRYIRHGRNRARHYIVPGTDIVLVIDTTTKRIATVLDKRNLT